MMANRFRRGATTVEMTLVGIPLIFVLISIFEMSRGMWVYHTLAYAVKEGVRYSTVHGENCGVIGPINNSCLKTANQIIQTVIQPAGVGLETAVTNVTFIASGASFTCPLDGTGTGSCAQTWPPDTGPGGANSITRTIQIDIKTPFRSALAMFWPGAAPVSFAVVNFGASSSDRIQF